MGGKPRSAGHGLRAEVIFESTRTNSNQTAVCVSEGVVYISGISYRGTHIRRFDELTKSKQLRFKPTFTSFLIEGDDWVAGGPGGLFFSSDAGDSWSFEPIAAADADRFRSVVRSGDKLWAAGEKGTLVYGHRGEWIEVERPGARAFGKPGGIYVAFGTFRKYPQVAISNLVKADSVYALGHGLWRLRAGKAELELASDEQLISLAQTRQGTLLVGGIDGALYRKPEGGEWQPVSTTPADFTCVAIVELDSAILFVGTDGGWALQVSTDDGVTVRPLGNQPNVADADHRFQAAAADGQGGAIVAAWNGLVVRVARDPKEWTRTSRAKKPTRKKRPAPSKAKPLPSSPEAEAKFLADIREAPESDEPRLIYADWLSELQDPRGEFIQIQCLLGRAIYGADGYSRDRSAPLENVVALEARESALYKKHRRAWMAPFAKVVRKFRWRRGFLEGFTSGKTFFDNAKAIFAAHPLIELRLQGLQPAHMNQLAKTELPGLKILELSEQRITPEILEMLLQAPAIRAVEELDLWGNEFGEDGARVLAANISPALKRVRLTSCQIGQAGLTAILDAAPDSLEAVTVRGWDLTEEGKEAIRNHPRGHLVPI